MIIVLLFLAFFGAYFGYGQVKYGSVKAFMFRAPIKGTVGAVAGATHFLLTSSAKVHSLAGSPEDAVGLELVNKSMFSYRMVPIKLSKTDAIQLSEILDDAATQVGGFGEIQAVSGRLQQTTLKVEGSVRDDNREVDIASAWTAPLTYQRDTFSLPAAGAQKLATLLRQAAS